MLRPLRLLLCASTAALILGAAPVGNFIAPAQAQVAVDATATIAPPPLPVYVQPPIPGVGYLWVPGYWAWDGSEYYWVPGYWGMPPTANLYWTPAYWAWDAAANDYAFYAGYWGPTVGYYGGIDYGFGYTGQGYQGGYWRDNRFYYNQAANNLGGVAVATVYNRAVPAATNHVAYNGGSGGTTAKPTPGQLAMAREHHIGPTAEQERHVQEASRIGSLRYGANHGRPPITATARAGDFNGQRAATREGEAGHAAVRHEAAAPGARPGLAHGAMTGAPARFAGTATHGMAPRPGFENHGPARQAFHHAPAAQHFARRAPAAPQHFASRAPMRHAPAMQHFAGHAPMMHAAAMPHFGGGMRPGGMHFAGGGMHMGGMHMGAPHMGGGPAHRP